jgi:hypothetical protein
MTDVEVFLTKVLVVEDRGHSHQQLKGWVLTHRIGLALGFPGQSHAI